ncbi:MAG: N-acetylmuramoyl-L-alanine amidase [Oscillospiraceae bacterium]|nr:N-acetylmuramoyl-L-alanine amidase [Oscillospiraceae bacterium]
MSKKIYISAGHGFNGDPGAVNGSRKESDDNLSLSIAVEHEAKSRGYMTRMARTVKNLSPGIDRVADAKNWGADCYIEIHRNAGVASANGFEVWTSRNPTAASTKLAEVLYKRLEPLWNSNPKRGIKKNTGNVNRLESLNPHMPCVLTEHGFVSNSNDNAKFDGSLIAQAKAIVDGLDEIYGKQSGNADNSGLTAIAGKSIATIEQMRAYIQRINPNAPDLASIYIAEGEAEGIRGDIAFAQSCLETGNFKFSGGTAVTLEQNNFCGMGVVSLGVKGNSYRTPQDGIRAQIQHLKAYTNELPLVNPLVVPTEGESRFKYVQRGCAPYAEWLGQKENPNGLGWAVGAGYGAKILSILQSIVGAGVDIGGSEPLPFTPYTVRITADALNVRIRAGVNHAVTGVKVKFREVYTIVEESHGADSDGKMIRWGRLKSGAGWIAVEGYTVRAG